MISKLNRVWRPWFLAVVVAVGFAMVWWIIVAFSIGLLEQLLLPRRSSSPRKSVTVLADGTLAIAIEVDRRGIWSEVTYETLDGKPMPEPGVAERHRDSSMVSASLSAPIRPGERSYRLYWHLRTMSFRTADPVPTVWWLLHDGEPDGSAWFEGYCLQTKRRVGYIGRNGFQLEKPSSKDRFSIPSRRFLDGCVVDVRSQYQYLSSVYSHLGSLSGRIVLLAGGQLLTVDLQQRTVKVLRESPDAVAVRPLTLSILSDGTITKTTAPPEKADSAAAVDSKTVVHSGLFLMIRTDRDIRLLDLDGKELHRFVMPESLQNKKFMAYFLGENKVLAKINRWRFRSNLRRTEFVWFDNQGNIEKEESVELPLASRRPQDAWVNLLVVPIPAAWASVELFLKPSAQLRAAESPDRPSAVVRALSDKWPMILAMSLFGAFCAWLCYRRQKRYAQPWTWLWVVTVFLFGLPGLVGYLTYRRWPPLEPCPSCNAPAPRDRETCHACGHDFPRPTLEGIEVFA